MATGDGCNDLFAGIGSSAWRQVVAQQERYLGFEHAVAIGGAVEDCAACGHPCAGHRREEGRGIGRGCADLPAADVLVGESHLVMNAGDLFERGGLQRGGQVGDRSVGAARIQQKVRGFDHVFFAGSGNHRLAPVFDPCQCRSSGRSLSCRWSPEPGCWRPGNTRVCARIVDCRWFESRDRNGQSLGPVRCL